MVLLFSDKAVCTSLYLGPISHQLLAPALVHPACSPQSLDDKPVKVQRSLALAQPHDLLDQACCPLKMTPPHLGVAHRRAVP